MTGDHHGLVQPDGKEGKEGNSAGHSRGRDSRHAQRWRLIAVPGRLTRRARHLVLRLPPGHGLLHEVLARLRALPAPA